MIVPISHILLVATTLFVMGLGCVLARRNLIMILIGVEIMLNAVGLVLVGGSALWQKVDGQIFVIFLMAMTAAEVGISLAMVVTMPISSLTCWRFPTSGTSGSSSLASLLLAWLSFCSDIFSKSLQDTCKKNVKTSNRKNDFQLSLV